MGVQINFYMDNNLQQEFIKYIYEHGHKIMDCMSANNKLNIYDSFDDKIVCTDRPLYIFDPVDLKNIFIKPWGQVDPLNSNIIEFISTSVNSNDMKISHGRIWLEKYKYANDEKKLKNQSLVDLYNDLRKYIKKNTKYVLIGQRKEYITDEIIDLTDKGYILK